ncbi:MAG: hypothetical protein J6A16_06610 [Oscillospiraceae bacterium]|nr:hypothetical protein [Oscillospiraceae bacterium]
MKKVIALLILAFSGAVIMTGLAVLDLWLFMVLDDSVALMLSLMLDVAFAVVSSLILRKVKQTKGISGTKTFWCFIAPTAVLGIFLFIKGMMTPSGALLSGSFFAGLKDIIFGIALVATDFVFFMTTACVFAMTENKTANSSAHAAPQSSSQKVEDNDKTEV